MITRYSAKLALNSILKYERIGMKTSIYLNGIASNHSLARGYATWPICATRLSIVTQQIAHTSLNRGKALDASKILPEVTHDKLGKRFYISDKDGRGVAFLTYDEQNGLITIMHTEVPKEVGGRGYGKLLAEEALAYAAAQNNYVVKIVCTFVRSYIEKQAPKYAQFINKT